MTKLSSAKLIVFDKDGVLLELSTWVPMMVGIAEYLVQRAGEAGHALDRDGLLASIGIIMEPGTDEGRILENSLFASGTFLAMRETWAKQYQVLEPVFKDEDAYNAAIRHIRLQRTKGKTLAKGDVGAELRRLREAGYLLAVATNDREDSTMMNFTDIAIDGMFDAIVAADSGFGRKPDPDGLLEICRRLGCAPGEAIMVGDTDADWQAARNAGYGGFVAVVHCAPDLPDYIPDADLAVKDVVGLGDVLRGK